MFLENHPALPNCLYLPAEDEHFEERTKQVLTAILRGNPLFGEYIKIKKPIKKNPPKSPSPKNRPSLFSDEPSGEETITDEPSGEETITDRPKSSSRRSKAQRKNKTAAAKKSRSNKKPENAFLLAKIK